MGAWKKAAILIAVIAGAAACGSALANPPSANLWKITARPVSSAYSLGEPVFFDLRVTNLSSQPASIDLGGDDKANLRITTTEPNGLSRPVQLRHGGLQAFGKHMVGAHATYTKRLVLNEWNDFREAGDYYAKIALIPQFGPKADDPPTADLHVSIGPRNEAKLLSISQALADLAINGRDVRERSEAALALSCMADPSAVPEMARVLAISDAGLPLTSALARLGGPSAINALQAAQSNPVPWIREAAGQELRALRAGKKWAPTVIAD